MLDLGGSEAPVQPDDADAGLAGGGDGVGEELGLGGEAFGVFGAAELGRDEEVLHVDYDEGGFGGGDGDGGGGGGEGDARVDWGRGG